MVIPVTGETEWAHRLRSLPAWVPSTSPTVVVTPHPDDETLSVGGLISTLCASSVDVTIVAVTDGEHAYTENDGLAELRCQEQTCALARLGVPAAKIVRLRLVDSDVVRQESELISSLGPLIATTTQVFAPWSGDFHPDHEACARAAAAAASQVGAKVISYFFWTWHRGSIATLDGLDLRRFALSEETLMAKKEALACHASQLKHAPEAEILPANLLWPARMPFEVFAL
jgi:LmbE family N-acetylglucosaminyl deacetylase